MNHSPLLETQLRLSGDGLRLVPVLDGTWELAAHYTKHGALAEYEAVGQPGGVGLIDRSWRSVLRLTGPDRASFLQGMVSNDIAALTLGQGCRAAFLDTTGHIQADLFVHVLADCLLVETDPRCFSYLAAMLDKYLIMEDVEITDVTHQWVILTLVGNRMPDLLSSSFGISLPDLPPKGNAPVITREGNQCLVAASYFVPGCDLWLPAADAPAAWERLIAAGATPVGEDAAEVLRVEAGQPAWGHELDASILLPEAELADAVSYTKGCYIGQEIIARLRARGHTNRALRGVLLGHDAPVPRPGDTLHAPEDNNEAGREIGRITSAVASPQFDGRALALAYVRKEYWDNGTPITVQVTQPNGPMLSFSGTVLTRPF